MPTLGFKKRFAQAVVAGLAAKMPSSYTERLRGDGPTEKRQTIRAKRKHPFKVGDTAYLFTGMRTRNCQRLGAAPCIAVMEVIIAGQHVWVGKRKLRRRERDRFARMDGFRDWPDLFFFFRSVHGLPFKGDLIVW